MSTAQLVWRAGAIGEIVLSDAEATSIFQSNAFISDLWEIEEAFRALWRAHFEFEKRQLIYALECDRQLDARLPGHEFLDTPYADLNISAQTFLSSSRVFEERIRKRIPKHKAVGVLEADLNAIFSEKYDNSFSYRLCYALRNHAMHNSSPLHGVSLRRKRVQSADYSPKGNSRSKVSFESTTDAEELINNEKINKKFRQELRDLLEKTHSFTAASREFLDQIIIIRKEIYERLHQHLIGSIETQEVYKERLKLETSTDGNSAQLNFGQKSIYINYVFLQKLDGFLKEFRHPWVARTFISSETD
ncbi:hypothetical protein [Palleronia abyssalis]|uniref:Uncharacterized protein n=1 Tax=Palleronia abyssalis TaxID=1501240 RepID=A0A2R8BUC2_9RHOB|nr:hypothetical protein [Palleronia abyssalis]SPJ23759.1 hypothetical protein PAA8504_01574 [Palleronia abyssalis]